MLITNVDIIRADGTAQKDMSVAVKGGRFAYIGKDIPPGEWGEVIDGGGNILIPGLVNSHTHVPMTLMRGYGDDMPLESWLFDRFSRWDKLSAETFTGQPARNCGNAQRHHSFRICIFIAAVLQSGA